jgi:hypothetical protein
MLFSGQHHLHFVRTFAATKCFSDLSNPQVMNLSRSDNHNPILRLLPGLRDAGLCPSTAEKLHTALSFKGAKKNSPKSTTLDLGFDMLIYLHKLS